MHAAASSRASTQHSVGLPRRAQAYAGVGRRVGRVRAPPTAAASDAASSSASPVRQVLTGVVSGIYKMAATNQQTDPRLPPLWQAVMKLDKAGVSAALGSGASANDASPVSGETPLLFIAKQGHYKYPPADIPALLIGAGADLEAKNADGRTALEVSLLSGWQNIAELLIASGASGAGVGAIKDKVTCPDCKRVIANHNL